MMGLGSQLMTGSILLVVKQGVFLVSQVVGKTRTCQVSKFYYKQNRLEALGLLVPVH